MNIVSPRAEMWLQTNINSHIVRCAKVCYRSDREVDDEKFIQARLKAGHFSILRHGTKYYKVPIAKLNFVEYRLYDDIVIWLQKIGYVHIRWSATHMYVVANMQSIYEHPDIFNRLMDYEIDENEAYEDEEIWSNIYRYTFYLQTQISTTRELNRVSPNNILEESTRYVEQGVICRPWWCDDFWINHDRIKEKLRAEYFDSCEKAFKDYNRLMKLGLNKEDARGVLPLDTCTHVVYTYTIEEWRNIIDKRFFGSTGKPHPNCQEIIGKVKHLLEKEGYEFE